MSDERIYEWDVVREGDDSPPFVFAVTPEAIRDYCRALGYENPIYLDDGAAREAGFPGIVAPPTMCYTYAPMRRVDVSAKRGYVAPEQSEHHPRSTPFVATEITFLGTPVHPGDVVTSTTAVHRKWERKDNRFITFLITADNERGQPVARYTYTCIWEYAKGRKPPAPQADVSNDRGRGYGARAALCARTVSFAAIEVGDTLPVVTKTETQDTIDRYRALAIPGERSHWKDLHTDAGYARQGIFGGTVNMGVATVGYVAEVLERAFPLGTIMARGARLAMQAREPFRAGDSVSFTGRVVAKHDDGAGRRVDVEIEGTNQCGRTVARTAATVVFPAG